MSALLSIVQILLPVSAALEAALATTLKREEWPARQQLLLPGQVARHLYFVESGLVRGYALHDSQEVCSWFMSEGDFVISIVSFLTQQPSTEYVELIEPSVLYSVSYAQLQELYRAFPEFNYVGRVLTERYYVRSEQRAYQLRALPGGERYARFVEDFPNIVQRLPLKYLASYLGIAPETLSRLRAKRR